MVFVLAFAEHDRVRKANTQQKSNTGYKQFFINKQNSGSGPVMLSPLRF